MKTPCSLLRSGENSRRFFYAGLFFISLFVPGIISAQQISPSKAVASTARTNFSVVPFSPSFVANKGQFDQYDVDDKSSDFVPPSFGCQMGNAIILFNG